MTEGRYVLGKGEKVLWEGSTVKNANLKEKGTNFKAIWISIILIAASVVGFALTRFLFCFYVAFFCFFVIIGNIGYQTGKCVVTNKRILWGSGKRNMMYYKSITRNYHLTCYKSNRNIGYIKCVKDVSVSGHKHEVVYIRGIENPEQVCNIIQSVVDGLS